MSRNSALPVSMTETPGINLSESSFGVVSVCMNMERAERGMSIGNEFQESLLKMTYLVEV